MRSTLLPLLLFCSVYGSAQDSSFQLKDYKYRTPGFHALQANISMSGSFNETDPDFSTIKATSRSFQMSPTAISYQKLISTDKRRHESSITLRPLISLNSGTNPDGDYKRNRSEVYATWDRNDRFYKPNLWFFEIGNSLSGGVSGFKQKDFSTDNIQNGYSIGNALSLGVGKGRIERVQDAQMALYILNDLAAQGLLNGAVTNDNANALAQLITDINNKRVFDSRKRRIYELTRIDSFLQGSGLVAKTDIRHFTTVNDNWVLAINPYRLSGSNWYLRIQPNVRYSRDNNENKLFFGKAETNNFVYGVSPVLGYENYVPSSLKWQHNMGASVSYLQDKTKVTMLTVSGGNEVKSEAEYTDKEWRFNGFYGIGFFPNNRTQLRSTLNLTAYYQPNIRYYLTPSLDFNLDYFVSYRTYLTFNAYANYNYFVLESPVIGDGKQSSFNTAFTFGLSHILF